MDTIACCYLLENSITNDQYVGVTTNFNRRLASHKYKPNKKMSKDIEFYGWDKFNKTILIIGMKKYCYALEPKLIKEYNTVYNTDKGGSPGGSASGELNGKATLTEKNVIAIRTEYARGNVTHKELATRYNVTYGHISNITSGKFWKDAEGPITNKHTWIDAYKRIEIRKAYTTGKYTIKEIMSMFNVKRSSAYRIISGISLKQGETN